MDYAASTSPAIALSVRAIGDAWCRISRAQWTAAALFGAMVFTMHLVVWSPRWGVVQGARGLASPPFQQMALDVLGAVAMMLAMVVAERVTGGDADRKYPYALAVVIGAAAATALDLFALSAIWHRFELELAEPSPDPTTGFVIYRAGHAVYLFAEWLTLAGLATFAVLDRRMARLEAARLHRRQLEYIVSARRVLEARLLAMQARVEPDFLLGTLTQVRSFHAAEPERAAQMLDTLIAFLRAAMPRMREMVSTLAREVELATVFLELVKVRSVNKLVVEIDVPADIRDTRMPPMLILPLIGQTIGSGAGAAEWSGTIRIRCRANAARMRLDIAWTGRGASTAGGSAATTSVRERLSELYGDAATVEVTEDVGSATACLEIPLERDRAAPPSSSAVHVRSRAE